MRFNGPVRSSDEQAIASDLKIMKIMIVSGKDKSTDKNTGKDKGKDNIEETKDDQSLSSKCLVDQLPNTVCVSVRP